MNRHLFVPLALLLAACGPKKVPEPAAQPEPASPAAPTTPAATQPEPEKRPEPAKPASTPAEKPAEDPTPPEVRQALGLLATDEQANLLKAVSLLEDALKKDPNSALIYTNLGVARYKLNDAAGAKKNFDLAVQKDPSFGASYLYLGVLQEKGGNRESAVISYRTGVRNDPKNMELRVALISALRAQGKLDEAIKEAQAALRINANSLPVYNNLGLVYMDKGDLELARFVYQKAMQSIDGAEQNALIRCNLGRIYHLRGEKGPALFHLLEAVKLDPDLVPANIYLSQIYMDDRNFGDMVPLLERALKKDPENHGVLLNLGVAYRGVGRFEDSRKMYEKALLVDPANPDPYFNLGVLYGDYLKQYDQAIDSFKKYSSSGGKQRDLATEYIAAIEKEKERAAKKAKAEQKAKEEAERKKQEQQNPQQPPPAPEGGGQPSGGDPWGGGGGQ